MIAAALDQMRAAGVRLDALSRWLGSSRIVRVMPNIPAHFPRADRSVIRCCFCVQTIGRTKR